ncbi:hypothetical protein SLA2020_207300 [Shorea laevis]
MPLQNAACSCNLPEISFIALPFLCFGMRPLVEEVQSIKVSLCRPKSDSETASLDQPKFPFASDPSTFLPGPTLPVKPPESSPDMQPSMHVPIPSRLSSTISTDPFFPTVSRNDLDPPPPPLMLGSFSSTFHLLSKFSKF